MPKERNIIFFNDNLKNKNVYKNTFKKLFHNTDNINYSKVVVRKPWGYEYVIFQSKKVAITILYINKDFKTSMHCHPRKKTSLIVLDGKIECKNLKNSCIRKVGQGVFIDKKVFHQSTNISNKTSILMEIETPNMKYDILRYKDSYGRSKKGYEKSDKLSVNTTNYNYISLKSSKTYHNITKKFGKS